MPARTSHVERSEGRSSMTSLKSALGIPGSSTRSRAKDGWKPSHKRLPGRMAPQLAEKVSSLGGRGFSPGVKLLKPMGFSP